jgi:hypothetical protein
MGSFTLAHCRAPRVRMNTKGRLRHGHARRAKKTAIYLVWARMHDRCYNPDYHRFHRYGGRGIRVCVRWHSSNPRGFRNFLADMGEHPGKGYSLGDSIPTGFTVHITAIGQPSSSRPIISDARSDQLGCVELSAEPMARIAPRSTATASVTTWASSPHQQKHQRLTNLQQPPPG